MAMSTMHPVKIAHAHQRGPKVRRNFIEFVKNVHVESL